MTVIGPFETTSTTVNPLFQRGSHLRRNMLASIYNSILMAWKVGVRFDGSGVGNAAQSDTVQLRNNIFGGNLKLADSTGTGTFAPQSWLQKPSFGNTILAENTQVQLTNPFNIYPDVPLPANNVNYWIPLSGSPALSGSSFTNPNLNGFEVVSYRGAFGTANWTTGWTQFNPKNYEVIGINQISSNIPNNFSLKQNYPNPFNPNTIINYQLQKFSNVSLKVYDVLGNEVSTLVNQKQNAGSYEVGFNATALSSGIYFYTLKTEGYSETKRMLLVK